MKIYVPNYEPDRIGGGWSWADNFVKNMGDNITFEYGKATHFIIPSASTVSYEQVNQAERDKKLIILRCDNALRDSRNRSTGMSRMLAFAKVADLIVFQSKWAQSFLSPFLYNNGVDTNKPTTVILNGVNTEIYNTKNRRAPDNSYLYARSSRDEGKQWIMAWYWFVNNSGTLEIAGKFSPENMEYNFDFYNNEQYRFVGEQPNLVDCFKRNKYFLYSFLNEAGSNTLLEARASGCEIINVYGMLDTGCGPEYMALKDISIQRVAGEYYEAMVKL